MTGSFLSDEVDPTVPQEDQNVENGQVILSKRENMIPTVRFGFLPCCGRVMMIKRDEGKESEKIDRNWERVCKAGRLDRFCAGQALSLRDGDYDRLRDSGEKEEMRCDRGFGGLFCDLSSAAFSAGQSPLEKGRGIASGLTPIPATPREGLSAENFPGKFCRCDSPERAGNACAFRLMFPRVPSWERTAGRGRPSASP